MALQDFVLGCDLPSQAMKSDSHLCRPRFGIAKNSDSLTPDPPIPVRPERSEAESKEALYASKSKSLISLRKTLHRTIPKVKGKIDRQGRFPGAVGVPSGELPGVRLPTWKRRSPPSLPSTSTTRDTP